MIDYKIRNRASNVVTKAAEGTKFQVTIPDALQQRVNKGEISEEEAQRLAIIQYLSNTTGANMLAPLRGQGRQLYRDTRKAGNLGTDVNQKWGKLTNEQKEGFNYAAATEGVSYNGSQFLDSNGTPIDVSSDTIQTWKADTQAQNKAVASQVANAALGVANQVIDSSSKIDQQSSFGSAFQSGWDSASDLVGTINPMWGAIAKGAGTVMKAVDNIFATDSDSYSVDDRLVADLGGSYGGTVSQMEDAASRAGKYGGLFSNGARRRANKAISKAKHNQSILNDINQVSRQQQDLVNQMGDQSSNAYQFDLTGGYKQQYMRAAKEGGVLEFEPEILMNVPKFEIIVPGSFALGGVLPEKIDPSAGGIVANKEWTPDIVIDNWTPEIVTVSSFKPGGRIAKALDAPETEETEQKSVIPEGSLHKDKHHMENTEGMTKKGIPVVDDDSKQQAEIERNEIIFTKEVTKKLEELYKVYYDDGSSVKEKDEAAIDAGKLLTKEIMLNTDDRTGLIDTLQNGGALNYKGEPYTGRSLDELVEYAEKMNPRFIQRLHEFPMIISFKDKKTGETHHGSHLMSSEYNDAEWQSDENPGPVYVFPTIMETKEGNGNLKLWKSAHEALKEALKRGDYLKFDNLDEAEYFTTHYKEHYNVQSQNFDDMEHYLQAHPKANPVTVRKMFMGLMNETTER